MFCLELSSLLAFSYPALAQAFMLLLFILPAYIANAAPVLLGGLYPIDRNFRAWDGRPLFGKSKTWLGLAGGFCAGMLCTVLLTYGLRGSEWDFFAGKAGNYILLGILLVAGALLGDILGSFAKRRLGMLPGQPSFILDQLAFLAMALLLAFPLSPSFAYTLPSLAFLFAFTFIVHRAANLFAHMWGIKKVPW